MKEVTSSNSSDSVCSDLWRCSPAQISIVKFADTDGSKDLFVDRDGLYRGFEAQGLTYVMDWALSPRFLQGKLEEARKKILISLVGVALQYSYSSYYFLLHNHLCN